MGKSGQSRGNKHAGKILNVLRSARQELMDEWPIWRLIDRRMATLTELETVWSLDDVMRANAVADISDTIQAMAGNQK